MQTDIAQKTDTVSGRQAMLPSKKFLSASTGIYLGLIATAVIIKAILASTSVKAMLPAQAASQNWKFFVPVAILGLVGVWLSQKTGFPAMWDARISSGQRFLIPALLGLAGASILVLLNLAQPLGQINVPFPASILFYVYGGIESEIVSHLIPIPFFLWLISSLILRNRWQAQVFWGVAIVLSLVEPLGMISVLSQMGLLAQSIIPLFMVMVTYGINLIGAYLFRKSGFLAPLTMRLSLYLIWHVVFGAIMNV